VADGSFWGRLVENAVGAHLLTDLPPTEFGVTYWRDGTQEVDFVVTHGKRIWAIEVKSSRTGKVTGLAAFTKRYPKAQPWLIGGGGVPLDEFFARPATDWFK
jgi:predicted AAA+ superfamily ATPase